MTKEEKELLFKDLCGRLPYGVKINVKDDANGLDYDTNLDLVHLAGFGVSESNEMKPYLRLMEDMTEEECDMVEVILGDENIFDFMRNGDIILKEGKFTQVILSRLYDYFNSIHVDYRGLIPKGLALEAPEGMYN